MVLASHVIFSAYGFWLPNDPRGSWSEFVGSWELLRFGRATQVSTRRSLARAEHDVLARVSARQALKYPPVCFTGLEARAVGRGFASAVAGTGLTVRACSILPEHVHMVIARHARRVEQAVGLLKAEATRQLGREGIHPLADHAGRDGRIPTPWGRGCWKVFLDSAEAIRRAVRYVRDNPLKEGKPRQHWSFVGELTGLD